MFEHFSLFFLDEYDHLDYTRPGSSFKDNYHRMNNNKTLNITEEESEIKENNLDSPASSPDDNSLQKSKLNLKD